MLQLGGHGTERACATCAQVTCLNLAGNGLRGAALGLNNVLGAPLLPPLAFLQGLDLHNNQLWGARPGMGLRQAAADATAWACPAQHWASEVGTGSKCAGLAEDMHCMTWDSAPTGPTAHMVAFGRTVFCTKVLMFV